MIDLLIILIYALIIWAALAFIIYIIHKFFNLIIMSKPLYIAIVKETKKTINVYKHKDGGYIDFENCKDKYSENEITIIRPKKKY